MTNQEKNNLLREKKLIRELERLHKDSYKDLIVDLIDLHNKYEKDGILTYAEMIKYNRLSDMLKQIEDELNAIWATQNKAIVDNIIDGYEYNYLYTSYLFEGFTGIVIAGSLLPRDQIRAAVLNPLNRISLPGTLEKNRKEIIQKTREELTKGLIKGLSMKQMTKNIQGLYDNNVNKAKRIVQTETTRNANAGTDLSYQRAREKGVRFDEVWTSTLDSRTRKQHGKLDGQKKDEDGYFRVGKYKAKYPGDFGYPEMDINCRCGTIAQIAGTRLSERRIRGEGIVEYKTYEQWKEGLNG